MKNRPRSTEEWRLIVNSQKRQNQTDVEYARDQAVGVASLRAWRAKFRNQESSSTGSSIVEIGCLGSSARLVVILPNGIRIEVAPTWQIGNLGQIVGLLRSL